MKKIVILLFILLLMSFNPVLGLIKSEYKEYKYQNSSVYVIKTPGDKIKITTSNGRTLKAVVKANNGIGGSNASFFSLNNYKPCGLLIIDNKLISKNLYSRPYIVINQNNNAYISDSKTNPTNVKYAVGGGSWLVRNGNEYVSTNNHFTKSFINLNVKRTVIGIDKDDNIILAVITNCNLYQAARIMKDNHAVSVINLDGGSSSQLYYNGKNIVYSGRNTPILIIVN